MLKHIAMIIRAIECMPINQKPPFPKKLMIFKQTSMETENAIILHSSCFLSIEVTRITIHSSRKKNAIHITVIAGECNMKRVLFNRKRLSVQLRAIAVDKER